MNMKNFLRHRANALKAVAQIRAGEWRPKLARSSIIYGHLTAERNDQELWIGNGAFFCEIRGTKRYFGYIWRHYVWWVAARKLKNEANESRKGEVPVLED